MSNFTFYPSFIMPASRSVYFGVSQEEKRKQQLARQNQRALEEQRQKEEAIQAKFTETSNSVKRNFLEKMKNAWIELDKNASEGSPAGKIKADFKEQIKRNKKLTEVHKYDIELAFDSWVEQEKKAKILKKQQEEKIKKQKEFEVSSKKLAKELIENINKSLEVLNFKDQIQQNENLTKKDQKEILHAYNELTKTIDMPRVHELLNYSDWHVHAVMGAADLSDTEINRKFYTEKEILDFEKEQIEKFSADRGFLDIGKVKKQLKVHKFLTPLDLLRYEKKPAKMIAKKGKWDFLENAIEEYKKYGAKTAKEIVAEERQKQLFENLGFINALDNLAQASANSILTEQMYNAVKMGNTAQVALYLNQGFDIDTLIKTPNGLETILHTACYEGLKNIIELLVDVKKQQTFGVQSPRRANVNLKDSAEGATPLLAVVSTNMFSNVKDRLEVVKLLCKADADVTVANNENYRPSQLAEEPEVKEFLLQQEAQKRKKSIEKKSVIIPTSSTNDSVLSKVLLNRIRSSGKAEISTKNFLKTPLKWLRGHSQTSLNKVGQFFSSKSVREEEIIRNPRFSITPEISGMIKNNYLSKFPKLSFGPAIGPKEPFKFRPRLINSIVKIFGNPLFLCNPDMIKKIETNYLQKERTGLIFRPTNDATPEGRLRQFIDSLASIRSESDQLKEIATFTDRLAATPSSLRAFIRELETKRNEKNEAGNIWELIASRLENKHKTAYNAAKRERADIIDMAVLKQFINAQLPPQSSGEYKRKKIADIANLLNKRSDLFSESTLDKAIEREKDTDPNYANILRSIKSNLQIN